MIEKLEYLIALAHEKHFGRAAELCAVSQPSLSLGLKQLEEALGVLLVQRGSRFIGLTAEGERTLEWARRIVGDARAMRQDITALKRGLTGRLRIAVAPAGISAATPWLRASSTIERPSGVSSARLDSCAASASSCSVGSSPFHSSSATSSIVREAASSWTG